MLGKSDASPKELECSHCINENDVTDQLSLFISSTQKYTAKFEPVSPCSLVSFPAPWFPFHSLLGIIPVICHDLLGSSDRNLMQIERGI